jgi:hypothetical protein
MRRRWEDYVKQAEARAQAAVDEAVDQLCMQHKEEREAIKCRLHDKRRAREIEAERAGGGAPAKRGAGAKKAAAAAAAALAAGGAGASSSSSSSSSSASSSSSSSSAAAAGPQPVWDVQLTVTKAADASRVGGAPVLLRPQRGGNPVGMCRVGRSEGAAFAPPAGLSLSWDSSVSLWHGKITCIQGRVYYTDLEATNGSQINGEFVRADEPHELASGDTLTLGDVELAVALVRAAPEAAGGGGDGGRAGGGGARAAAAAGGGAL